MARRNGAGSTTPAGSERARRPWRAAWNAFSSARFARPIATLTGWCQQHDAQTFSRGPVRGRSSWPPAARKRRPRYVRFLMRFERPTRRIVSAVDAAVAWLRTSQLSGMRVEKVPAPAEEFERHRADFDTVVIADHDAPRDLGPALRDRHRPARVRRPRRGEAMRLGRDRARTPHRHALVWRLAAEVDREGISGLEKFAARRSSLGSRRVDLGMGATGPV